MCGAILTAWSAPGAYPKAQTHAGEQQLFAGLGAGLAQASRTCPGRAV